MLIFLFFSHGENALGDARMLVSSEPLRVTVEYSWHSVFPPQPVQTSGKCRKNALHKGIAMQAPQLLKLR